MNQYLIIVFAIVIMIPASILIYNMLPRLIFLFDKKSSQGISENKVEKNIRSFFSKIPIPNSFKNIIINKIYESGLGNHDTWIYWIGITVLFPIVLYVLLSLQKYSFISKICLCLLCVVLPNVYLTNQIEKRKRAFIINAYKLYYFLHSQISSGIKVTDAIKGLHEIADHPLIQKTFINFVAQYELTLNIEESLQVLRKSFSGYDCEMLCVSIQQCVNTGMAGKTLLKMEQMMFSKYFFYLQKDTEKYKTTLLIAALFAIVPLVMIFLMPVIYDAFKAFKTIIGGYQ